jgi:hypothetical protein
MTAIDQSLLTGPSVTLSRAHLTPTEVAKWITHKRAQSNSHNHHQQAFMGDDRAAPLFTSSRYILFSGLIFFGSKIKASYLSVF